MKEQSLFTEEYQKHTVEMKALARDKPYKVDPRALTSPFSLLL